MRKILLLLLLPVMGAFAQDQTDFQQFENEYNLGLGFSNGGLIDGAHQTSSYNAQTLDMEVEHLFNNGVWMDGSFSMVTNYSQPNLGYLNGGNGSGNFLGSMPFMYSALAKVGYAFQLVDKSLQLTPYGMFGQNSAWSEPTILANGSDSLNKDYFFTGGLGARLSYRIDNTFLIYADQNIAYDWDQSGAVQYIQSAPSFYGKSYAATNYTTTSTIGAKFNVYKDLQLGIDGYWNNYQHKSNIAGVVYVPTNTYGTVATIGLTY